MRRIILPSVICLALPPFSTLSHKRHDFRGKKIMNIRCVFWFRVQLLSEIFIILRRIQPDITTYLHRSMQSTRYSCEIWMKLEYPLLSFKKSSNKKLRENPSSRSWVIPFGRTDTTKLIVVFRNFVRVQKFYRVFTFSFLYGSQNNNFCFTCQQHIGLYINFRHSS